LGLPFVLVDEELKERTEHFTNMLPGVYAEYEAITEMAKTFPQEIPDFLQQKMDLLSAKVNAENIGWLYTIFEFIGSAHKCSLIVFGLFFSNDAFSQVG
jgi:hypothetical protein